MPTDIMICGSPELSALDLELARVANAARPKLAPTVDEARKFGAEHVSFHNFLANCLKAPSPPACITHNYLVRTTGLQIAAGLVVDPSPVPYRCSDNLPMAARFYTTTATLAVVLSREGVGVGMAFGEPGKPGTFVGDSVSMVDDPAGLSRIRWQGVDITCRPQSPP